MLLGEAFISLSPTLDQGATRGLTADAARVGNVTGQALADAIAKGVSAGMADVAKTFKTEGEKAGREGGEKAGGGFAEGLSKGKAGVLAVVGGLGLSVGSGFTAALDVTKANDKMRAQLGSNAPESARLGKLAGSLYASNYGESMADVNAAITSVVQNIPQIKNASEPVLKSVASGALDVARVFDQDVGGTTKAVGQLMRTGLAPDAQSALDLITVGLQKIPGAGEDLLDTFNEYGTQFRKLGLEGPQALGLINQLVQGGARDTDVAADAIKEFSIRAIDGSKTTVQGFKDIGLNADQMAAAIAKGGPSANAAFGTVIDKLNAIEDPVKRNTAGVALFGTQWEDLGGAFKNADLDTAAASLGKVGGATKNLVDQSAGAKVDGFMRKVQSGFVEVMGNQVIPALQAVAKHFAEHKTLYTTLAVVVGVLGAAYLATSAVIAVQAAGGLAAYLAQMNIVKVATTAWTGVQWLLNAALSANPIGIVIVAVAALIAAIVLLWKNSETFRGIVLAVWGAIKTAIAAVADWFTKTVWPALKTALDAVGAAFSWLNTNVIQPVWRAIQSAISVAWSVIKVLFAAGEAYIRALAAVFTWLWHNIIEPVWNGIKLAIQIAWVPIRVIFGLIEVAVRAMALVFQWFYTSVILPVWNAIKTAISAAWTWLKTTVFDPLIAFVRGVLSAAWQFYSGIITTVWNAIKTAVSAAWAWIRDSVLNPLRTFVTGVLVASWQTAKSGITSAWDAIKTPIQNTWNWIKDKIFTPLSDFITKTIPNAFSTGVTAVGKAWDKVKELAAAPVRFVVNTVINGGIIKGFNWIAEKVGAGTISPISLGFATGGVLPGYTPGKDVHRFISPTGGTLDLSGGEAIMRPEFTKAVGSAFINAGNAAARNGGVGGVRDFLSGYLKYGNNAQYAKGGVFGHQKFDGGGILGGIVGGIKKAWDAFTNPVDTFKSMVNGLMGGMPGGPFVKDVLQKTVGKMVDGVASWITQKFDASGAAMGGAGGPGNWSAMWGWVKSRFPQAQLFSGLRNSTTLSGNKSLHASGRAIDVSPIRAISSAIISTFGKNITELISPWKADHVWHGQRPHDYGYALDAQHGVYGNNAHIHWAMKLGGILKRIGIFDTGGWLANGGIAVNKSGRPEAVLTPEESAGLKAMGTDKLVDLLEELIDAVREVAPGVGGYIRGSGKGLTVKARSV